MISKYFKYTSNCFEVLLHIIHILTSIIESGRAIVCGSSAVLLHAILILQVTHILPSSIWNSKDLSCHGIQRIQKDFELLQSNTPSNTCPYFNSWERQGPPLQRQGPLPSWSPNTSSHTYPCFKYLEHHGSVLPWNLKTSTRLRIASEQYFKYYISLLQLLSAAGPSSAAAEPSSFMNT